MTSLLALAESTWYVDAGAAPPGDGSFLRPYTRIDHAVAQPTTLSGDTVLVVAGTYADERIDVGGRELTIASLSGAEVTVVEGAASGSIVTYDGSPGQSVLRGLTFRGGRGSLELARMVVSGVCSADGVGGEFERFPLQPPANGGPVSSFGPVLAGFPSGRVVTAGETWFFHLWLRDVVGGVATSNLSPALFLRFE